MPKYTRKDGSYFFAENDLSAMQYLQDCENQLISNAKAKKYLTEKGITTSEKQVF